MLTGLNAYLLLFLFGTIPAILFLLGRAATSGTAPEGEQMDELRRLAVRLNDAAEKLLTEATHAFSASPGERQALDALIRLADTAEMFRIVVLSPLRSQGRVRRAFQDVQTDFQLARLSFPALKAFRSGQERIQKLDQLIEDLRLLYDARTTDAMLRRAQAQSPRKISTRQSELDL